MLQTYNKIFKRKNAKKPLTIIEIKNIIDEWKDGLSKYFTLDNISGNMCNCGDNKGEFVLAPINSKTNKIGGKLYMKCRNCNCSSHI